MKKSLFLLLVLASIANAGFIKHVVAVGAGIAVGHAADKVIDYEIEKYKKHTDANQTSSAPIPVQTKTPMSYY